MLYWKQQELNTVPYNPFITMLHHLFKTKKTKNKQNKQIKTNKATHNSLLFTMQLEPTILLTLKQEPTIAYSFQYCSFGATRTQYFTMQQELSTAHHLARTQYSSPCSKYPPNFTKQQELNTVPYNPFIIYLFIRVFFFFFNPPPPFFFFKESVHTASLA